MTRGAQVACRRGSNRIIETVRDNGIFEKIRAMPQPTMRERAESIDIQQRVAIKRGTIFLSPVMVYCNQKSPFQAGHDRLSTPYLNLFIHLSSSHRDAVVSRTKFPQ